MLVDRIIYTGLQYLGTPYVFNAPEGRTDMFDCSSFIQYIFRTNGLNLPRNSRQQFLIGQPVPFSTLQEGDLLFFTTNKRKTKAGLERIGHVALYLGNKQMLHTFRQGKKVKISNLNKDWIQNYVGARRVI